ncbi:hypothetical protein [Teichococcus cervicalis]|uniref:Uncharacterized protein n=1 Tax=Pseudoroseomonas cervicalis ATCC 49957 TaxID=525371 RepID=D5RMT9_9PROT|nr:hypothetical protein [Pseudoroseomonas cervicalis]EFH11386.1 hypothetical protein HMPREF0731_2400 [Pseudoroseomonas cervicalis ATCC 49957]
MDQPLAALLTEPFLEGAAEALTRTGFLSDEHDFVGVRDVLARHPTEIEAALRQRGHAVSLHPVTVQHDALGPQTLLYNSEVFAGEAAARDAIRSWMDLSFDQS